MNQADDPWRPESLSLRIAAVFMIYLTVSLVFIGALSTRVEATFNVVAQGEDAIPGFRRTNDTTTINVYADSDIVRLLGSSGAIDLSCAPAASGGYTCSYSFPRSYQGSGTYTLRLEQQDGTPPTTTASYVVDGTPPRFTGVRFTQLGGSISVSYDVEERSSATGSACSGLEQVRLLVNDNVVATDAVDAYPCDHSGLLTAPVPGLDGPTKIRLVAIDRLGNLGLSAEETRTIDTVPPGLPSSFELLRNGVDVTELSTQTSVDVRVTLRFTVAETALDEVRVDASQLTSDATLIEGYRGLVATCRPAGGQQECTVPNLKLNPAQETVRIAITATDRNGNRIAGNAVKSLTIQNTQPTVTYFGRPDRCATCFLTTGQNTILAEVTAPGGMRGAGLFFEIDGRTYTAGNCTQTGGAWRCTADISVSGTSGHSKTVRILPQSMDDLGNRVTGALEKAFTIDTEAPRLLSQPVADTACPVAGQTLTITLRASDRLSPTLTLSANSSEVTDRDAVSVACTPSGSGEFACSLPLEGFLSIHTRGTVAITLSDEAGNTVDMEMELEVCEAETEVTPNFITAVTPSVTPLPAVDRRIASLTKFRVVIPLRLTLVSGSARTSVIKVQSPRCPDPMVVGPTYLMNEFTTAPILVTHFLHEGVWPNSSIDLNCTLDFTMRRGNVVYLLPEIENISLPLPLVGEEIGNPGQAIRDKETKLVAEINRLQDRIKSKDSLDDTIGKYCRMIEMIVRVNALLQSVVKVVLGVVSLVLYAIVPTKGYGEKLWNGTNSILSPIHKWVQTLLWPPGWYPPAGMIAASPWSIMGYTIKWICGLYTCKLYDAHTYSSIILQTGVLDKLMTGIMNGFESPSAIESQDSDGNRVVTETGRNADGSEFTRVTTYNADETRTVTTVSDPLIGQPTDRVVIYNADGTVRSETITGPGGSYSSSGGTTSITQGGRNYERGPDGTITETRGDERVITQLDGGTVTYRENGQVVVENADGGERTYETIAEYEAANPVPESGEGATDTGGTGSTGSDGSGAAVGTPPSDDVSGSGTTADDQGGATDASQATPDWSSLTDDWTEASSSYWEGVSYREWVSSVSEYSNLFGTTRDSFLSGSPLNRNQNSEEGFSLGLTPAMEEGYDPPETPPPAESVPSGEDASPARSGRTVEDCTTPECQNARSAEAITSIAGDDWIVNPYRSARMDSLCIPAQLYNLRKEKMLKCIELRCIRELAPAGLPITQCEQRYAAQHCLYVQGGKEYAMMSATDLLWEFIGDVAMATLIDYGTQWVYKLACKPLQDWADPGAASGGASFCNQPGEAGIEEWNEIPRCTVYSMVCGTNGALFHLQELTNLKDALRNDNPTIPVGQDFCEGLDGVTGDTTR